MKIQLFSISADDAQELALMQKKLNTWITTGLLKKYQVHTTATHVIFNICLTKKG
jgi:hypothetical protein